MREGKKISKRRLNKWKASEKVRAEEIISSSGGNGCFAPKYAHQSVPKSLLKVMQMSQAPIVGKGKHKPAGSKILKKEDRRYQKDTHATNCHLRQLKNSAKSEAHKIQEKQAHADKVQASRTKKERPELTQRQFKISKMLNENRRLKLELKKEKRKEKLHGSKRKRNTASSDEDELVDRNGYDEVAFGEVADAPPRFTTIDKLIDKLRRRKIRKGAVGEDEAEAADLLHLAP